MIEKYEVGKTNSRKRISKYNLKECGYRRDKFGLLWFVSQQRHPKLQSLFNSVFTTKQLYFVVIKRRVKVYL